MVIERTTNTLQIYRDGIEYDKINTTFGVDGPFVMAAVLSIHFFDKNGNTLDSRPIPKPHDEFSIKDCRDLLNELERLLIVRKAV